MDGCKALNGRAAARAALGPGLTGETVRLAGSCVCILPGQPDVQYSAGQLKIVALRASVSQDGLG